MENLHQIIDVLMKEQRLFFSEHSKKHPIYCLVFVFFHKKYEIFAEEATQSEQQVIDLLNQKDLGTWKVLLDAIIKYKQFSHNDLYKIGNLSLIIQGKKPYLNELNRITSQLFQHAKLFLNYRDSKKTHGWKNRLNMIKSWYKWQKVAWRYGFNGQNVIDARNTASKREDKIRLTEGKRLATDTLFIDDNELLDAIEIAKHVFISPFGFSVSKNTMSSFELIDGFEAKKIVSQQPSTLSYHFTFYPRHLYFLTQRIEKLLEEKNSRAWRVFEILHREFIEPHDRFIDDANQQIKERNLPLSFTGGTKLIKMLVNEASKEDFWEPCIDNLLTEVLTIPKDAKD